MWKEQNRYKDSVRRSKENSSSMDSLEGIKKPSIDHNSDVDFDEDSKLHNRDYFTPEFDNEKINEKILSKQI